jgi:hypothetical protein
LASEFGQIKINPFTREQAVANREEDDDAIAQVPTAGLYAKERPLHPAIDFRFLDNTIVGVDAMQQRQLDVRDAPPQSAIKLTNLILASPVPGERDDLVFTIVVEGRD